MIDDQFAELASSFFDGNESCVWESSVPVVFPVEHERYGLCGYAVLHCVVHGEALLVIPLGIQTHDSGVITYSHGIHVSATFNSLFDGISLLAAITQVPYSQIQEEFFLITTNDESS